ncbi:hypothetical protein DFH27DRAFT_616640 [Peziza echinospora]|nr:hypothetical protein DFH27DRAFT_616640 [Peziza echinospora]
MLYDQELDMIQRKSLDPSPGVILRLTGANGITRGLALHGIVHTCPNERILHTQDVTLSPQLLADAKWCYPFPHVTGSKFQRPSQTLVPIQLLLTHSTVAPEPHRNGQAVATVITIVEKISFTTCWCWGKVLPKAQLDYWAGLFPGPYITWKDHPPLLGIKASSFEKCTILESYMTVLAKAGAPGVPKKDPPKGKGKRKADGDDGGPAPKRKAAAKPEDVAEGDMEVTETLL